MDIQKLKSVLFLKERMNDVSKADKDLLILKQKCFEYIIKTSETTYSTTFDKAIFLKNKAVELAAIGAIDNNNLFYKIALSVAIYIPIPEIKNQILIAIIKRKTESIASKILTFLPQECILCQKGYLLNAYQNYRVTIYKLQLQKLTRKALESINSEETSARLKQHFSLLFKENNLHQNPVKVNKEWVLWALSQQNSES